MKKWFTILIFLIIIFPFFNCSYAEEPQNIYISASYRPNLDQLEELFKKRIPLKQGIIYTKVPRGLVISIDEEYFFHGSSALLKESSLPLLRAISKTLKELPNRAVVEDHTEDNSFVDSDYSSDWELSVSRAANIVNYIIMCENLPWVQIFALGFGEFMPFKDNVAPSGSMNNRVDFVIIDYEVKR